MPMKMSEAVIKPEPPVLVNAGFFAHTTVRDESRPVRLLACEDTG
jgi:hypothetical protein